MRIFSKYLLLALAAIMLVGCVKTEYVNVPVIEIREVKVATPCVVPEITCDFSGDGYVPTAKLLECIIEQKHVLDKLREAGQKANKTL